MATSGLFPALTPLSPPAQLIIANGSDNLKRRKKSIGNGGNASFFSQPDDLRRLTSMRPSSRRVAHGRSDLAPTSCVASNPRRCAEDVSSPRTFIQSVTKTAGTDQRRRFALLAQAVAGNSTRTAHLWRKVIPASMPEGFYQNQGFKAGMYIKTRIIMASFFDKSVRSSAAHFRGSAALEFAPLLTANA